jgi:hypothetical protein
LKPEWANSSRDPISKKNPSQGDQELEKRLVQELTQRSLCSHFLLGDRKCFYLTFLPSVPLLVNFTITFTKKKKKKINLEGNTHAQEINASQLPV